MKAKLQVIFLTVCNLRWTIPIAAQPTLEFSQLPSEIRNRAIEVRKSCSELFPEMEFDDMQGIQVLDVKGDGSRDIVVDDERLCGRHISGETAQIVLVTWPFIKRDQRGSGENFSMTSLRQISSD
jgi:hypothetical protein